MMGRNQKFQIIALVIAIVGLGIGFAAFSNTITISQSASVNPDSGSFNVVFTKTQGTIDTGAIVPTKSPSTLIATSGTIDSTNKLTLTNLGATFTEPGQSVEYNLYVYNAGAYTAYLNSVTFKGEKTCTPADNTVHYVDSACNGISMTVKVGSTTTYSSTTQDITGQSLAVGASTPVKVRIEYASNGTRADGSFSVTFPDVSLYYVTTSGINESSEQGSYAMLVSPSSVGRGAYGVFSSEADLSTFDSVTVDGQVVNSNNYISQSGSTIIRLKPEFTQTLLNGNHRIEIISNGGKATANFQITDGVTFTISNVGTFHATEGMTWADWIWSYGIGAGDNGIAFIDDATNEVCVEIGNGLWTNYISGQHYTDVIQSTTYEIDGPM